MGGAAFLVRLSGPFVASLDIHHHISNSCVSWSLVWTDPLLGGFAAGLRMPRRFHGGQAGL